MSIAPFSLVLRCCLQLALFLALSLILPLAQAQVAKPAKRIALLIGNAAYPGAPNGERRLNNPVNDATLLAKVLKDEVRFDQVTLLTDQKAEALDTAINRFIDQAASVPLDTIIVYFSGHGIYGVDRHNYLLGIDANTGVPNARALKWQGVRATEVRDRLKGLKARVALLILDACRNGPGSGKTGDKGLRHMGSYEGLLVAYAAAEGEVADDGAGATGPYAAALAQAWRNTGLSILFQFAEVASEVKRKTGGQQPTFEGNLHPGEALLPEQSETVRRQHAADWDVCKTALTVTPCEQYRSKYPQGEYFVQSGTRITDIRAAQKQAETVARSTGAGAMVPPAVTAGTPQQPGQVVKDCDICPEMVLIPGGQFVMGDDKRQWSDEKPAHRVSVPGFMLGKFEVTQGQWRALMGSNPSYFKDCGDNCPVEQVSWEDAQAYLKKLSDKTGQPYRLPTEAEWEYAARAGSTTQWSFGDDEAQLGRYAWHGGDKGNAELKTHAVGGKLPNQFGLYDMHGNVREWVEDCWHDSYQGAPVDGSAWLQGCSKESSRVLRGGGFDNRPVYLRAASRSLDARTSRYYGLGMRVAWTPR